MKLTEEDIQAKIENISYFNPPGSTTTICVIKLQNGFTVTGTSACVDPAEFNESIGKEIALDDAVSKVWELEGYLLAQRIYEGSK